MDSLPTSPLIALASTFLFVPATRIDRIHKALACGANAVILDLEDAVAPDAKIAARSALMNAVSSVAFEQRTRIMVRINAADSPWYQADIEVASACVRSGLAGVMVPKAESAHHLRSTANALGPSALLVPLVESGAGLDVLDTLAQCPQVARLAFGHLDFQADLGMSCAPEETELLPVRLEFVRASRRAGLAAPVDGVTTAIGDLVRLSADTVRSRQIGFGAKLCIHPSQIDCVNSAFMPSASELDWSRRVLHTAPTHAGAAFQLDGRMVDEPVLALARRVLARADGSVDRA